MRYFFLFERMKVYFKIIFVHYIIKSVCEKNVLLRKERNFLED